jgi:polyphenol oxidase
MASMGGISLGLMLGGASSGRGTAEAAPIVPPDLGSCRPASVNSATNPSAPTKYVDCCLLPPKRPIVDFAAPKRVHGIRTRRPAHRVNAAHAAKYARAYELMRALPDDDPRSLRRQADIHCAFCNGAYVQLGSTNKLQVRDLRASHLGFSGFSAFSLGVFSRTICMALGFRVLRVLRGALGFLAVRSAWR